MCDVVSSTDKKDKKAEEKESDQNEEEEEEDGEEGKGTATRATTRSASRLEAERQIDMTPAAGPHPGQLTYETW